MSSPTQEAVQTMPFADAMRMVAIEETAITKLEWPDGYYARLRNGKLQLHKPEGTWHDWIISDGDLAGTDYVIHTDSP